VAPAPQVDPSELLRDAGLRPTAQRLAVVRELEREPNGASAQDLHVKLRRRGLGIGLATVYRTLQALTEHGTIDSLLQRSGETSYRLCGHAHHHHLTCVSCQRIVELEGCSLEEWLGRVSREQGFALTGHQVELAGVCSACQT
jgi:Fur family ferric uptake transcriptional regulator